MAFQRGLRQRPTQRDLFDPLEVAPPVATPAWQLLPEGAPLTATKLMPRLLVDHERARSVGTSGGGAREWLIRALRLISTAKRSFMCGNLRRIRCSTIVKARRY